MADRLTKMGGLMSKLALLSPFIIGYALIDAWSQTVFSTSFFAQTTTSDQILKSVVMLIPSLVLLLLSGRVRLLVRRRYREVIYIFGMAASFGTGLLLFVMYGALDTYWTKVALSLLSVARVCLIVCWWERLTAFPLQDMWLALGCAIAMGAVFNVIPVLVPEVVRNSFVVAAPLVSTILLPVRGGHGEGAAKRSSTLDIPKEELRFSKMLKSIPWMLVIVLGLMNIPSEALVYLEMIGSIDMLGESNPLTHAFVRMIVNLTAVLLACLAVRVNISMAFFIAVPVVIVVSFVLALGAAVPVSFLHTVCRIGSEMVRYVVVYLLFSSVTSKRVPALFCFSFMTLVHGAGSALGVVTAFGIGHNATIIAMLFMGILLMAMLFVLADMQAHGPLAATRGDALNGAEVEAAPIQVEDAAASAVDVDLAIAEHYGLTQREYEVFRLWVRGRTAAYIEEQLCISKYTVKTHVNHIYEKTGVNSKEDLISLAERFAKSL